MTETLRRMGLKEWRAHWKPGCSTSKRGETLPESKLILIYDAEEKAAFETLIHEAMEIKLRPVTQPYRSLINALIEWADQQVYKAKEEAINSLLPFLQSYLGEVEPNHDSAPKGDE